MTKFLISVVGPTAIGKTSMAIKIAEHFNTEIISADSRQVYREMRIGTAVPSKEELQKVTHHFIQDRSIKDSFNVGDFEKEALSKLKDLFKVHDVVVMVGGSGLYIDAVTKGLDEFPDIDPHIRKELNKRFKIKGLEDLFRELKTLDPATAENIDPKNSHRVMRALEVCLGTGKPYSSFLDSKKSKRFFKSIKVGLDTDRKTVYERIEQRVNQMISEGLVEEVESLKEFQDLNALNTVGYKEIFEALNGLWDMEHAISEIKKNSRRFAKRQLTWFRKDDEIKWFDHKEEPEVLIQWIIDNIKKTG